MSRSRTTSYHVRGAWWLWAWLCLAASLGGVLLWGTVFAWLTVNETLTSDEVGPPCCTLVIAAVALLLLARYAIRLLFMRLTTSTRGLTYRDRRTDLTIPWSAVRSLCVVKWHRRWLYDGLWIQPTAGPPLAIPVALFDADWPQGTLGASVQRHVPQLFATPGAQPAPSAPSSPPRRRRRRKPAPSASPADAGETQMIPPAPLYNTGQPAPPPAEEHGVDTIRF